MRNIFSRSGLSLFPSLAPLLRTNARNGSFPDGDCWIILTWARLCAVDCPFDPVLSCRAVDNAVCVFHWDDATPAQGVHRCFAVVAQADRPRPALSDMTVMQNGLMGETGLRRTMPHWPQPGLIPRDPARGDRLETIAYFGSDQYEPQFVKTGAFQDALRQRGVRFVNRFQGEWHDYQHVDAVLAIRDCPPVVLATKPASKLINAWKAGVPALLGPEPAYRELRTSRWIFWKQPRPRPCWTPLIACNRNLVYTGG